MQYFAPIIAALRALSGSGRPGEATDWVAANLGVSDDERSELTATGIVRFDNAVAWARFYLAKAAIIDASKRGVWTLTEKGRTMPTPSHDEVYAIFKDVQSQFQRGLRRAPTRSSTSSRTRRPRRRPSHLGPTTERK